MEPTEHCTYKVRDSKSVILKQIDKNPGIRYQELLRLTGLTNDGLCVIYLGHYRLIMQQTTAIQGIRSVLVLNSMTFWLSFGRSTTLFVSLSRLSSTIRTFTT